MEFDFDNWKQLAQNDPEEFERRRQTLIDEAIPSAPAAQQRKLKGLQFKIDMERRKGKNPLDACIRLNSMMHAHFAKLREELEYARNRLLLGFPKRS